MKAMPGLWKCVHAQRPAANKTRCTLACEARERTARLLRRRDSMTHQNELQFLSGSTFGSGRLKYAHYAHPYWYHSAWRKMRRKSSKREAVRRKWVQPGLRLLTARDRQRHLGASESSQELESHRRRQMQRNQRQ